MDESKFSAILQHVAMHYNKGWDNGMRGAVKYWAIWTEPEFPEFWSKPPEQLFAFYKNPLHAKEGGFPRPRVGGIGKAFAYEPGPYREGFSTSSRKSMCRWISIPGTGSRVIRAMLMIR